MIKSNELDDTDDFSFPPVTHRRRKSKDESISSTSISPTSPQTNPSRISSGFSFPTQSFPSFLNPRHTLLQPQSTTNERLLSQCFSSTSLIEENLNEEQTNEVSLLDFGDDHVNDETLFEKSFSSDKQQEEFNSSYHSQRNLLDDDFDLDLTTSQKNSTSIISPTTISKPEQKSSSKILFDRCHSFLICKDVVLESFTVLFLFLLIPYIRKSQGVFLVPLRWDI